MDQEVAKTLGELELKLQELERELTSIGHRDPQPSRLRAPGKLVDEAVEQVGGAEDFADEDERSVDNAFGGPAVFGGEEIPAQGSTIERDSAFPVSETAYGEIATGSPASAATSFPSGVFSPATTGLNRSEPPLPPPIPPTGPPLSPPGPTPQPPSTTPPGPPTTPPGPPTTPPGPPTTPPGPPATPPGPPSVPPAPTPQPPPPPQPIDRADLVRLKEKLQRTMEDLIDEFGKLLRPKPPA